jgi:hypothetical protein
VHIDMKQRDEAMGMRIAYLLIALTVAACATPGDNRGWTGSGAQPFDSAVQECQAEALSDHGPAFEACMAVKGWTRTPS